MKLLDKIRRSWRSWVHDRMDEAAEKAENDAEIRKDVVEMLGTSSMSGRDLRDSLWKPRALTMGLVNFYHRMAQLEDAGVIEGWYQTEVIDGQSVRQRWYRVATT